MSYQVEIQDSILMTPGIRVVDNTLSYWLMQVNLRLRREIAWCWLQRTGQSDPSDGSLPPVIDAAAEILDWTNYFSQKQHFFETHPTIQLLTEQINQVPSLQTVPVRQGSWSWIMDALKLDEAAQFALALAVAQRLDPGLAPVIAHSMNDLSRPFVTPALAQRLWHDPLAMVSAMDADHALFRYNLLRRNNVGLNWQQPLEALPMLVDLLLSNDGDPLPYGLSPINMSEIGLPKHLSVLVNRLTNHYSNGFQVVSLLGSNDSDFEAWAATISATTGRRVIKLGRSTSLDQSKIEDTALYAWLKDVDVLLPWGVLETLDSCNNGKPLASVADIPVRWYIPLQDKQQLNKLSGEKITPPIKLPELDFLQRVSTLHKGLGEHAQRLQPTIEECARRFRFQELSWQRVLSGIGNYSQLTGEALLAACRVESDEQLASLAQRVKPRFSTDELVLPKAEQQQYQEVLSAMRSLTQVHYKWGAAQAWNESGLSVLFCGPPGTGKTMAAEAAACDLDMDMYRIDLSQVVNKYIGETEKNLKQIFDAAERTDCILFFDECDALFGKRTDVKDAHDRFANIEVSYLLERMERFKGLAILATNRRKDLDEAFMRRLRYVIEFPIPDVNQRERIWQQCFPQQVDVSELDFRFFAKQFSFSGGHIRSVAFNSCLQAAAKNNGTSLLNGKAGKVTMSDVLVQVKRELQKLNRSADDNQFGRYAENVRELTI